MFGNTRKRWKGKTLVTFLLDRTGSMVTVRDDTIGAFNAYLEELKKDRRIDFSLIQFDSTSVDKLHVRVPVKEVPPLTEETFVPRDFTPLIDAGVKTIRAVEQSLKDYPYEKVVVCILTDGQENASTEYTWTELKKLVGEKREAGWQFNFMGAGIDAYDQGARMGIRAGETVSYEHLDPAATRAAFVATASNTQLYSSGVRGMTTYTEEQKTQAKDRFRPHAVQVEDFKL